MKKKLIAVNKLCLGVPEGEVRNNFNHACV